jgi:hypothetical protein
MQSGREMEAKSIEHARRHGSEIIYQTPTTVKHQSILTMEVQQILIIKHQTPIILEHQALQLFDFATMCPFPEKFILQTTWVRFLFPLSYTILLLHKQHWFIFTTRQI